MAPESGQRCRRLAFCLQPTAFWLIVLTDSRPMESAKERFLKSYDASMLRLLVSTSLDRCLIIVQMPESHRMSTATPSAERRFDRYIRSRDPLITPRQWNLFCRVL